MKLVVVESPNKCEKIQKYLGPGYEVAATVGHFRDLPDDELGVDLSTFEPTYVVSEGKKSVLAKLRSKAAAAAEVLLATDADREGEAIAWHVAQALRLRGAKRIRFTEITEAALKKAVSAAGPVDQQLVDAQQARRVLDRLVGYQVSPLLRPLGTNHSAGRVQSATLHLVVSREKEREAFKPEPYWTLTARYGNGLSAEYAVRNDKGELVETRLKSEADAQRVVASARGPHVVQDVKTEPVERKPKPPFTTSSLQQAASVALGLRPDRTMQLAQALFEKGAITYHRTDSVALSPEAVAMARAFIAKDFPEGLPEAPPQYRSKSSAQEAHEAIRPTALELPEGLTPEEAQLYELIGARFLASQCKPAVFSRTVIGIRSGDTWWRASGEVLQFKGFLHFLTTDEDAEEKDGEKPARLPAVRDRRGPGARRHRGEAEGDHPSPALHPGEPHQGDGAARHRPTLHLRGHGEDAVRAGLHRRAEEERLSDSARAAGGRGPRARLPAAGERLVHRGDGGAPRRGRRRQAPVEGGAARLVRRVRAPARRGPAAHR